MFKIDLPPDTGPIYTYTTCCECDQLRKRCAELKAENEKLRGDYEALALHHDAAHSDASRKELISELVLANSLLDVIDQMLDGKDPDDFSESFPIIRKFSDYKASHEASDDLK